LLRCSLGCAPQYQFFLQGSKPHRIAAPDSASRPFHIKEKLTIKFRQVWGAVVDRQSAIEEAIAALGSDASFAAFTSGDAAMLVLSVAADRLLWTSPAAAALADAIAGRDGAVRTGLPARSRLRALGQGLAPAAGVRLERLRFDAGGVAVPTTCAVRRITLSSGEEALVVAITGPVPKVVAPVLPVKDEGAAAGPSPDEPRDPIARLQGRGTVRFLWQTDEAGRFIAVTDALADVVGEGSAALTGLAWGEIAGALVIDPAGRISSSFARRETWSAETVHWRIAGTDRGVAVDLAGMPVFDRARQFVGFRGFGLCRTDVIVDWSPADAPLHGVEHASSQSAALPADTRVPVAPTEPESAVSAAEVPQITVERDSSETGDRAASGAFMAASVPEREKAAAGGAALVEAHDAAAQQPAEPRAAIPITGLRGRAAAHLGATPVPLRPREDHEVVPSEPGTAANDDGEPATQTLAPESKRLALLSSEERNAFREIARSLGARFDDGAKDSAQPPPSADLLADARVRELAAILDTATDGVIILNDEGRIVSLNRSAEALFGYDQADVAGESVAVLLAPESHEVTGGYLEGLRDSGVATLLNDGREVLGRVRQGGVIPLFMTIGRISEEPERKFCVVLRDMTAFKTAEAELLAAKRAAQEASAHKSDFLSKLGDELRTPLNAIIGFAELMREERFGSLGNERYRDAIKDIHACGRHIGKILDGMLDLAKIEAGRFELSFTGVNVNDLVANCLAEMLQQATRERIVMRTSFAPKMPAVVADERSLRQVVLNVVSNAVKFTSAGGQVIISTAMTDRGEVALRVRDTGVGMTDEEIRAALEPLRQPAPAGKAGAGLGLALAKALIEANRGALHITSTPHEGTLVEVLFPPTRVLAE
jgi:PAS domain S-box-containing protein